MISITKSWPMTARLPLAEQRKPTWSFSLRLAEEVAYFQLELIGN
jgi:hypothetical protein